MLFYIYPKKLITSNDDKFFKKYSTLSSYFLIPLRLNGMPPLAKHVRTSENQILKIVKWMKRAMIGWNISDESYSQMQNSIDMEPSNPLVSISYFVITDHVVLITRKHLTIYIRRTSIQYLATSLFIIFAFLQEKKSSFKFLSDEDWMVWKFLCNCNRYLHLQIEWIGHWWGMNWSLNRTRYT